MENKKSILSAFLMMLMLGCGSTQQVAENKEKLPELLQQIQGAYVHLEGGLTKTFGKPVTIKDREISFANGKYRKIFFKDVLEEKHRYLDKKGTECREYSFSFVNENKEEGRGYIIFSDLDLTFVLSPYHLSLNKAHQGEDISDVNIRLVRQDKKDAFRAVYPEVFGA